MLTAQEANQVDKLNQQLKQLQESFDKQQRELKENFERLLRDQQAQIEALKKQLEASKTNAPPSGGPLGLSNPPAGVAAAEAPPAPWSPAQPIRIGSAQNYINLSFDALVAAGGSTARDIESLQQGDHDPHQRGFTVQNVEMVLDGAVDPYLRGQGNIVLQIDDRGDTSIELEEAYLTTTSLPHNLQVKGGQYFSEFGRLNPQHPHSWDFVDQPLVQETLQKV